MFYSKRHIEGLPSPKEYLIKSLNEYIDIFSSNKFINYIYRGEPTNYHDTVSSALRDGEYPFIKMKNDFKREIYHRLNDNERKDFLAFSQHYGIPTNLVDFTKSNLIALFFACQPFISNEDNFDTNRGFVYLLKNDLIDITDLVHAHEDDNFIKRFIENEDGIVIKLYNKFSDYEKHHPEDFYKCFKNLNDDWKYYFIDMQPYKPKNAVFPKYDNNEYGCCIEYKFIHKHREVVKQIENEQGKVYLKILEYTLMLQEFLQKILDYQLEIWWLNCIPNFLYAPHLTFERGINQQGLFIYQAYLSFEEKVYNTNILTIQRIWPEFVIVIENKETILRDLDFLGINEKLIYGDYDSIAKYIKKKYKTTKLGFNIE